MLLTAAARRASARRVSEDLWIYRIQDRKAKSLPFDEQYMVIVGKYFKYSKSISID